MSQFLWSVALDAGCSELGQIRSGSRLAVLFASNARIRSTAGPCLKWTLTQFQWARVIVLQLLSHGQRDPITRNFNMWHSSDGPMLCNSSWSPAHLYLSASLIIRPQAFLVRTSRLKEPCFWLSKGHLA